MELQVCFTTYTNCPPREVVLSQETAVCYRQRQKQVVKNNRKAGLDKLYRNEEPRRQGSDSKLGKDDVGNNYFE